METKSIVMDLAPTVENPRNSEGAFATLRDGRVVFAYTKFLGGSGDDATAVIAARYSANGGLTWSERDKVWLEKEGQQNVMSVSLLRLSDGRLAMFYLVKNGFHDCRLRMRTTDDEGETWSPPVLCIPAPGYFVVNNDRVVQLSSGRLIAPAAFHRQKTEDKENWKSFDSHGIAIYFLSDDNGLTWRESAMWWALPVESYSGAQEPGVIELKDGRLFSWVRTDAGSQFGSYSPDQGDHWTPPHATVFRSPCSPLSIKRVPCTGELFAVWNDHSGRFKLPKPTDTSYGHRTPLVAAFSGDEGQTWNRFRLIEDDPTSAFAYTAIHFPDEEHVLLAYMAYGGCYPDRIALRMRRLTMKNW